MPAPTPLLKGFAKVVATTKPDPTKRLAISDPDTRGLYLRVTPGGAKTYTIVARNPAGKQVWATVGDVDQVTLDDAREKAREGVRRIKQGLEAFPKATPVAAPRTFAEVRDDFLKRHVRKEGQGMPALRSAREIHRIFWGSARARWWFTPAPQRPKAEADAAPEPKVDSFYIPAEWNDRAFVSIRRADITELLDDVQDENGSTQADAVLSQLSSLFGWYQSRSDDYVSPIVRGMRRTKPSDRARRRVLSDDEIKAIWAAADKLGTFGAFLRVALLTAQRKSKVSAMRWEDISDGVWTIPAEDREKGNAERLKLPQKVRDIIDALPAIEGNPFVFAGAEGTAIAGFSKGKVKLDEAAPMPPWVIHDLRRTAKTLVARARVDREISERVLGHVIEGVEGTYDRHTYFDEKAEALEKLSGLVTLILNPNTANVVEMRGAA